MAREPTSVTYTAPPLDRPSISTRSASSAAPAPTVRPASTTSGGGRTTRSDTVHCVPGLSSQSAAPRALATTTSCTLACAPPITPIAPAAPVNVSPEIVALTPSPRTSSARDEGQLGATRVPATHAPTTSIDRVTIGASS